MAEIICSISICHLTPLMLSHYLVKHKSTKFYSFEGKTVKNYVRTLSYRICINLITFGRNFMLGDQRVSRSTDTSADTTAPLDDSSIHDRLDKAFPLVDQTHIMFADVSYCGLVNFLLQYTPDAMVDWVQIR